MTDQRDEQGSEPHQGAFFVRAQGRAGKPWRGRITHAGSGESALVATGEQIARFVQAHLSPLVAEPSQRGDS